MVKNILKRNNILLSQFAADLNISRPTLDSYIRNFENRIPIQNALFRKIFDFLFSQITIDNAEFQKRYSYVISNYGAKHDSIGRNSLDRILKDGSIYNYLSEEDINSLGNLIINKDNLLIQLIKVERLIKKEISLNLNSEKEKMILVGLYEISEKLKKDDFSYNLDVYQKLLSVLNQNENTTSIQNDDIIAKINEAIVNSLTIRISECPHNSK